MKLNYLEASGVRPAKKFSLGDNDQLKVASYPNIKNFTSTEDIVHNIKDLYDSLLDRAAAGNFVLLKGMLDRPLDNESRAGHTNRTHQTQWFVLDIDGTSETDVNKVIHQIGLNNYCHIIQYSSSFGIVRNETAVKSGLRCHIYFVLDTSVSPQVLKTWVKSLNLKHFSADMGLTGAGYSLEWPLDPSVTDNSKLIYIAPAVCEEPFVDTISFEERIILVERPVSFVDHKLIRSPSAAVVATKVETLVKERRAALGLRKRTIRTKHIGKATTIIDNPDPGSLSFIGSDRGFAYYNLNGGDSAAYYHPIGNPDIVHSFKPEDYSFRHVDVDMDSYSQALDRANAYKIENGELLRGVGRDIELDKFFTYAFDPKENTIIRWSIQKDNIQDHLANHDLVPPDPIPDYAVRFDPTDDRVFDAGSRWINAFCDNDYGRTYRGTAVNLTLIMDNAAKQLNSRCPYITALMYHVLGNDEPVMSWFINWLAHMVQRRTKPGTALVMHGVPGTGKNVFMEHVLRPIIGEDYFVEVRMDHLTDSFTAWMQTARLILINEANEISMAGDGSKLGEMLKNIITESRLSLRAMRQLAKTHETFFGVVIASNSNTPLILDESDRRFTIARRQEEPLLRIGEYSIKDDFYSLVENWEQERAEFARLLYEFPIDKGMVTTSLLTDARETMIESGKTSTDEFCDAVKAGSLDYFLEAIPDDSLQTTFSTTVLTMANTNKLLLQKFITSVGKPAPVSSDELRLLYMMATGATQNINPIRFGKMLAKHGIEMKSGFRDKASKRVYRGIMMTWKLHSMPTHDATEVVQSAWRSSSTNLSAVENPPDFLLQ